MTKKMTYKKAGVDIDEGNRFVEKIKPMIKTTRRPEILGSIGGFGGFFKLSAKNYKEPILVGATDGVGTKLLVAEVANKFDTVGIDLVAMSVNDIITTGAEPLFFLDYFATGKLISEKGAEIVKGVVTGCRQAGCALLGGETAEMPGVYGGERFDLAGFCIGIVDKKKILDGRSVKAGDRIIGLASSGLHSNGFSLVRKLFSKAEMKGKFRKEMLEPTTIYVKPVLKLRRKFNIKAIANITGGGFYDNIPRVLSNRTAALIYKTCWPVPKIFKIVQKRANLEDRRMFRTFNMGIGMVLIGKRTQANLIIASLARDGIKAYEIGEVIKGNREVIIG